MEPPFALSIDARIAESVLRMLRADADLSGYFRVIAGYELEQLLLSSYPVPALGVIIEATEETRRGTTAELATQLLLPIVTQPIPTGTDSLAVWARSCVVEAVKKVLMIHRGAIPDYEDPERWIAQALTRFARLPIGTLHEGAHIVTPLRVTFYTDINQATRETL